MGARKNCLALVPLFCLPVTEPLSSALRPQYHIEVCCADATARTDPAMHGRARGGSRYPVECVDAWMVRPSLSLLLLAVVALHMLPCGQGRKTKRGRHRNPHDSNGLYPLYELEPTKSGQDIKFSDGHTSRIQNLGHHGNDRPPARAFHVTGLLRQEEAAELIAEAKTQPGGPQLSGTERRDKGAAATWRNSEQVWVPRRDHPDTSELVRTINQRTAELTRIPVRVVADGSIQVARYEPGGHYYPHFDSNPLFQLGAQHLPAGSTQGRGFGFPYAARYLTLLVFLNTPLEGGNTTFPFVGPKPMHPTQGSKSTLGLRDVMGKFGNVNPDAIGLWQSHDQTCDGADGHLSVAPKAGDAVLFYNHHVGSDGRLGELDPASFHGGCSVLKGEKWIANYWIEIEPPFCAECLAASEGMRGQ